MNKTIISILTRLVLLMVLTPISLLNTTEIDVEINEIENPNNCRNSVVIGYGTTHMNIPIDRVSYSYSQTIYYSDEIGVENQLIQSISWFKQDSYTFKAANLTIYMGHTEANEFINDTQWLELAELTQVFEGFIPATNDYGWFDITLDIPFDYDNSQNLVIAVHKNGLPSDYDYYGKFSASTSTYTRTIVYNDELHSVDLSSPILYSELVDGYPNIKLNFEYPQIASLIVATPTNCNFHDVHIDLGTVTKTITLYSKGIVPFVINQQPDIIGSDYQDFEIINDTTNYPITLNYNDSIELELSFDPSSVGPKSASLLVGNDLINQTAEFSIAGIAYDDELNESLYDAMYISLPVENQVFLLMPSGDVDYYLLENLYVNDTLYVSATNVSIYDLQPYVSVKDSDGFSIANSSDDRSEVEVVIPSTGDYYLYIDHNKGNYMGLYELNCYYKRNSQYTPPVNFQVSCQHDHIELSWEEPDNDFNCVGYYLYRNDRLYSYDYFPASTTSYLDYDVNYTNEYSYQLVAIYSDPDGCSIPSNTITRLFYPTSEPILSDSFEDNPDFSLQVENWIQYDLDESATLGLENVTFENQNLPMSFMVFNPSQTFPLATDITALTGEKMLASFPNEDSPNNDWLVSPRMVSSGMSLISFFAKSYSPDSTLAKIRINYSLGSSDIEDLIYSYHPNIDYLEVPPVWTRYDFISSPFSGYPLRYAIQNITSSNAVLLIDDFTFFSGSGATNNSEIDIIPSNLMLQNYPNPFNPETTISFTLPNASHVILDIYNLKGQKVKTLTNEYKASGKYDIVWKGTDQNNNSVASGVYLYKIRTGKYSSTKKMILMK